MAPSLNFNPGRQQASNDPHLVFFDQMADNGVLESRIVVHEEDGLHFIEESHRCVETITTDRQAMMEVNMQILDNEEFEEER